MTSYVELTEDRKLLGAVMSRFCAEQGLPMIQAIMAVDKAHHACPGEHPAANAVLAAAGAAFTLEDVQGSQDRTTKALEATTATPRPAGAVDAAGRVTMSQADADALIHDDDVATARWFEACERGLNPGDRDSWVKDARLFARAGCNLLETGALERHNDEVAFGVASDEYVAMLADGMQTVEERPSNPSTGALRMLQAYFRKHPEASKPAPEPGAMIEAERVFTLEAAPRRSNSLRGPFVIDWP